MKNNPFNRTTLINTLISLYGLEDYLEIGVSDPEANFNKIAVLGMKHGVDPDRKAQASHVMTSDAYFEASAEDREFGLIFIDGLHTAAQVYNDIRNAMRHLKDDGFIVVHDCNPTKKFHVRSYCEFMKNRGEWTGDVYKGFLRSKMENREYSHLVIEEDFGIGIITKRNLNNSQPLKPFQWDLEYEDFESTKFDLYPMVSYSQFFRSHVIPGLVQESVAGCKSSA